MIRQRRQTMHDTNEVMNVSLFSPISSLAGGTSGTKGSKQFIAWRYPEHSVSLKQASTPLSFAALNQKKQIAVVTAQLASNSSANQSEGATSKVSLSNTSSQAPSKDIFQSAGLISALYCRIQIEWSCFDLGCLAYQSFHTSD